MTVHFDALFRSFSLVCLVIAGCASGAVGGDADRGGEGVADGAANAMTGPRVGLGVMEADSRDGSGLAWVWLESGDSLELYDIFDEPSSDSALYLFGPSAEYYLGVQDSTVKASSFRALASFALTDEAGHTLRQVDGSSSCVQSAQGVDGIVTAGVASPQFNATPDSPLDVRSGARATLSWTLAADSGQEGVPEGYYMSGSLDVIVDLTGN